MSRWTKPRPWACSSACDDADHQVGGPLRRHPPRPSSGPRGSGPSMNCWTMNTDAGVALDVVGPDDPREVELGGVARLADEAGQLLLAAEPVGPRHLQGDEAVEHRVVRQVDDGACRPCRARGGRRSAGRPGRRPRARSPGPRPPRRSETVRSSVDISSTGTSLAAGAEAEGARHQLGLAGEPAEVLGDGRGLARAAAALDLLGDHRLEPRARARCRGRRAAQASICVGAASCQGGANSSRPWSDGAGPSGPIAVSGCACRSSIARPTRDGPDGRDTRVASLIRHACRPIGTAAAGRVQGKAARWPSIGSRLLCLEPTPASPPHPDSPSRGHAMTRPHDRSHELGDGGPSGPWPPPSGSSPRPAGSGVSRLQSDGRRSRRRSGPGAGPRPRRGSSPGWKARPTTARPGSASAASSPSRAATPRPSRRSAGSGRPIPPGSPRRRCSARAG